MELSAKNAKLISRAVRYFLAKLRAEQMSVIMQQELSPAANPLDVEEAAALVQDIADFTTLHQELDTYQKYKHYPLSD